MKTKAGMLRQSKDKSKVNYSQIVLATRMLIEAIGEDPEREDLRETPERVARSWVEFIEYNPGNIETAFQSVKVDQLVVVKDMRVWSKCAHHLLNFFCDISIGYITEEKVLGLSKCARICHKHAHKLQIQERLVEEIADELQRLLEHDNVAVIASGEHSCMSSRGIRTPGVMVCSSMNGVFRNEDAARSEFLRIAGF